MLKNISHIAEEMDLSLDKTSYCANYLYLTVHRFGLPDKKIYLDCFDLLWRGHHNENDQAV